VVPAIILVELLAQTGGVAAASGAPAASSGSIQLRVAAIGPFKFLFPVTPGAMLEARARVIGRLGRLYKIEGEVRADGVVAAVGSLTLAG
jgi:3-hydroxymyristoyl/3-hydroxydecanoyl-(acyl carrier protein) dehydratase